MRDPSPEVEPGHFDLQKSNRRQARGLSAAVPTKARGLDGSLFPSHSPRAAIVSSILFSETDIGRKCILQMDTSERTAIVVNWFTGQYYLRSPSKMLRGLSLSAPSEASTRRSLHWAKRILARKPACVGARSQRKAEGSTVRGQELRIDGGVSGSLLNSVQFPHHFRKCPLCGRDVLWTCFGHAVACL